MAWPGAPPSGDIDQLYVTGYNDGAEMGPTYAATVGDDSLTMGTTSQVSGHFESNICRIEA